jgi:hypothetical protein
MSVKLAPFLATILCLWLGKLAIPVPGDVIGSEGGSGAVSIGDTVVVILYQKKVCKSGRKTCFWFFENVIDKGGGREGKKGLD